MIGVDTNVLLRAVMNDHPRQAARARAFLAGRSAGQPAVVNSVVLAEFVWSLRSAFRMPANEIAAIVRDMVESSAYRFPDRNAVLRALFDYESGVGAFTDRLIAEINDQDGCVATVTFDDDAARHLPFAAMP